MKGRNNLREPIEAVRVYSNQIKALKTARVQAERNNLLYINTKAGLDFRIFTLFCLGISKANTLSLDNLISCKIYI